MYETVGTYCWYDVGIEWISTEITVVSLLKEKLLWLGLVIKNSRFIYTSDWNFEEFVLGFIFAKTIGASNYEIVGTLNWY